MKQAKKLFALLLALVMVLSLATTALANAENGMDGDLTGGSITITNALPGETYKAYQILYLESYDATKGTYAYKANSAWATWLKDNAGEYLAFDANGYVTWKKKDSTSGENIGAADFAKLLKGQLADKTAAAEAVAPAAATGATTSTVTLPTDANQSLKLGYYLVDTTVGTLCTLDTTQPKFEIAEKNVKPTITKEVKEDTWAESNNAKIGDTVEFQTTIKAYKGARNYKLHDQMEGGLTLIRDTETESKIVVNAGGRQLTKDTDYTIAYDQNCTDAAGNAANCDFEITFKQTYLDTINADTNIVVTYSAILNENAEISTNTNDNKTMLDFGNTSHTEWDTTTTKTFEFDIVKTDSAKKLLDGAQFELYDDATGGNKIYLVKKDDGTYRVATSTESNKEGFTSAVIEAKDGRATVKGLDSKTYWLQETKAPDGYNKLTTRTEVKIENKNLTTNMTAGVTTWADGNGGVQITNQAGAELPETGGIGTTIFYVVGSILLIGAGVLLVTKKRMSAE